MKTKSLQMASDEWNLPKQRLCLKFEKVDHEELKDVEIICEGDQSFWKVGNGQINHWRVPCDRQLLETQFMIVNKDGKYYISDLG